MSQIVERFAAAVQILVGDGPLKQRLMTAYTDCLEDLQQVELPVPGKHEFNRLHAELHRGTAVGNVDCVRATVQKMSSREAHGHARTIVRLHSQLLAAEYAARAQAENPLRMADELPSRHLVNSGH